MEQIPYDLEVQVRKISVERLLTQYWNPEPVREACKLCPDYGKVWSCPPGVPEADTYLLPEPLEGRTKPFHSQDKVCRPPSLAPDSNTG